MLVPISFGIGATLTALVGTNIGAKQFARAQRVAWSGALMAGGIAATIGIVVAIEPDLWLGLFTDDPGALASGRTYLSIVGPVYGFFGLAMALYFASQGTGEMVWPVIANLCRILIAVCGSLLGARRAGLGPARPVRLRGARHRRLLRGARLLDDAAGLAGAVSLALDRGPDLQSNEPAMNQRRQ